jgi:transcriptional regulator with XRE-family HTH domain
MNFGDRVKEARQRAQISQSALARRAEMSLQGVAKIEQGGVADPHYSTLHRLAEALEVNPLWLAAGVEEKEPVPLGEAPEAGPTNQQDPLPPSSREVPEDGDGDEGQRAVGIGQVGPEARIEVLEQGWISPVKKRNERWRAEIDGWWHQRTYPYGRADEMDAFARERILGRAEEVGLMAHCQVVLRGEKEVSAREFEDCRVLNNELFAEAFDLVAEAYKAELGLDQVRQGTLAHIRLHIDGGANRTPSSARDRIRRFGS